MWPRERTVRSGFLRSLIAGVIWYLLLHLVFLVGFGLTKTDQPNVSPVRPEVVHVVDTFDSGFYKEIANYGYTGTGSSKHLAFYPLYPLLLRIGQVFTLHMIDIRVVAFLLNGFFVSLTAGVLYLIGSRLKIPNPIYVVLFWLFFPWTIFTGALYTEALFCFLVSMVVLLTLNRQWLAAAITAGFASFTRLPGVMLGVLVLFEYLRQVDWPTISSSSKDCVKSLGNTLVIATFSFLGLMCWLGYQWVVFGSPFAFQDAYKTLWSYHVFSFNIVSPLAESTNSAIRGLLSKNIEAELFEVGSWVFACAIGLLSLIAKLKIPKGWYLFLALSLVLLLLNSNTVSINRYVVPIMVIYPMGIMLVNRLKPWFRTPIVCIYLIASLILQIGMAIRLVNFAWVG